MGFNLNKINNNAVSSSSSSTKFSCDFNKCSPHCCCHTCCRQGILNDHTYGILKRACKKIFKEFNRLKCQEKYAMFPGGDSMYELDKSITLMDPCDCGCYTNILKGYPCTKPKKKECDNTLILDMQKYFGQYAFFDDGNKARDKCKFGKERSKGGKDNTKIAKRPPKRKVSTRKSKPHSKLFPINMNQSQWPSTMSNDTYELFPKDRTDLDIKKSKFKKYPRNRYVKPSRYDEVRISDILRVKLENRDLSR